MLTNHNFMNVEQSRELINHIQLKHQTMLSLKNGPEISLVNVLHAVVMNGKIINPHNVLVARIMPHSQLVIIWDVIILVEGGPIFSLIRL